MFKVIVCRIDTEECIETVSPAGMFFYFQDNTFLLSFIQISAIFSFSRAQRHCYMSHKGARLMKHLLAKLNVVFFPLLIK